jgi:hypothetical protein
MLDVDGLVIEFSSCNVSAGMRTSHVHLMSEGTMEDKIESILVARKEFSVLATFSSPTSNKSVVKDEHTSRSFWEICRRRCRIE